MNKKIIMLIGSARKNGNTEILADAFIKGAETAGHKVDKILLKNKSIKGCLGCDYCVTHDGKCAQKDDMQPIYEKLRYADMVVFASPMYYYGLSSQLKAVIDRFYAGYLKPFAIKSAAFLMAMGEEDRKYAITVVDHYNLITESLGWENKGVVIATGVLNKGDAKGSRAIQDAEDLGKNMAF